MINYDDFKKIELKNAKILKAERVEGSEKLIKLEVDCSDKNEAGEFVTRQIVAGIGLKYQPEDLIGKTIIIVANLEPRKLMGLESQGMLLAASNEEQGPILLTVMEDINPGSEIR
jgi:methionyl-tRNA synthetase